MAQGDSRKQLQGRTEEDTEPINEQQIGAEFAKALQELARGEQTAANLESRLDDIESRIEQLLASAEENARHSAALKAEGSDSAQTNSESKSK